MPLLEPTLTLSGYTAVLAALVGLYRPLEAGIAGIGAESLGGGPRTALLEDDLVYLGMTPQTVKALPACPTLPRLTTLADAAGCVYVLEGATLGGQVLSRHLARHLGIAPDRGGRFLHGHGAETGPRWRAFVGRLDLVGRRPDVPAARVVAAAVGTFAAFEAWLEARGIMR